MDRGIACPSLPSRLPPSHLRTVVHALQLVGEGLAPKLEAVHVVVPRHPGRAKGALQAPAPRPGRRCVACRGPARPREPPPTGGVCPPRLDAPRELLPA